MRNKEWICYAAQPGNQHTDSRAAQADEHYHQGLARVMPGRSLNQRFFPFAFCKQGQLAGDIQNKSDANDILEQNADKP